MTILLHLLPRPNGWQRRTCCLWVARPWGPASPTWLAKATHPCTHCRPKPPYSIKNQTCRIKSPLFLNCYSVKQVGCKRLPNKSAFSTIQSGILELLFEICSGFLSDHPPKLFESRIQESRTLRILCLATNLICKPILLFSQHNYFQIYFVKYKYF